MRCLPPRYLDALLLTFLRSRGSLRKYQRVVYQVGKETFKEERHEQDHHERP